MGVFLLRFLVFGPAAGSPAADFAAVCVRRGGIAIVVAKAGTASRTAGGAGDSSGPDTGSLEDATAGLESLDFR